MPTILITGASSGLGLAFLQHYAHQLDTNLIALDIAPLPTYEASLPDISFHTIDITSSTSLTTLATQLTTTPIHTLIHSAGIRGLVPSEVKKHHGSHDGVARAETWSVMDQATMMRTLEVNTYGTFNVIKTFLPNLLLAASTSPPPKVVVMSSRMGSLAANTSGGAYAYRASKAGVNATVKSFAVDVPDVRFLLLHPGRVETGLVGWKEEGAVGVEESLRDCVGVVERLGLEGEDGVGSGSFVDRFGGRIEW